MTSHNPELLERCRWLRSHGMRATWQRQLIAGALRHHDGHRHAQAILDEVQAGHPTINPSTVYRTLSSFRDAGLVAETNLGTGELSYAWLGDERHHHESDGASDVHDVIIYRRMAVTPLDGIVDALNLTVPVRARQ